jgi:hypothetical protein
VSLFVVSPEIQDRHKVEVATGRSTKRLTSVYLVKMTAQSFRFLVVDECFHYL